jgi:DNA mismatch repair protein MutS
MSFESILFAVAAVDDPEVDVPAPVHFVDLNLDQIVLSVTTGREAYNLAPFFHLPLRDVDAIVFRLEVMKDLENPSLCEALDAFAGAMRKMHGHNARAEKLYHARQRERWFVESVEIYGQAVARLARDLEATDLQARGLIALREYVVGYAGSQAFRSLVEEARALTEALSQIQYTLVIRGLEIEVRAYDPAPAYSIEVEAMFDRFRQGSTKDYAFNFSESADADRVEAEILDLVAKIYPELFARVESFRTANTGHFDARIARFEREIQFYLGYLEYIAGLKGAGLTFCYPHVVHSRKEVHSADGFDLALADKLVAERKVPVTNDFHLVGPERIIVVSGPNQGGKTTFARTFGQLHYLACLGCPVPGSSAQLFLFDELLTHFERGENTADLRGKLQDDLMRVHDILERATPSSIVILNEIFTSTTLQDAVALSKRVFATLSELDLLCVWVTFVDELASMGDRTVSMVSTVTPEDPARRTFKVVRQPADGRSYAVSIAEKYRLTYDLIKARLAS